MHAIAVSYDKHPKMFALHYYYHKFKTNIANSVAVHFVKKKESVQKSNNI